MRKRICFWFTIVLTLVNFVFMVLGLLLTIYVQQNGIDAHKDALFPVVAKDHLGLSVFIFFLIGLVAAAYSSADSALTSLTTSFSIDILDIEKKYDVPTQVKIRKRIHIFISLVLILVIVGFKYLVKDESVMPNSLFLRVIRMGLCLGCIVLAYLPNGR